MTKQPDPLREALESVIRATEHGYSCLLNSMRGLVPTGTPCSCGLLAALDVLRAALHVTDTLDVDLARQARNHVRNTATEDASGGYRERAGCKCRECAALRLEYARLSETQP